MAVGSLQQLYNYELDIYNYRIEKLIEKSKNINVNDLIQYKFENNIFTGIVINKPNFNTLIVIDIDSKRKTQIQTGLVI